MSDGRFAILRRWPKRWWWHFVMWVADGGGNWTLGPASSHAPRTEWLTCATVARCIIVAGGGTAGHCIHWGVWRGARPVDTAPVWFSQQLFSGGDE